MNDKTTTYTPKKRREWTPERRAAQAERMKQQKPWLKATGPKTATGKQRSRLNSLKHGLRSKEMRELSKLLTAQSRFVKSVTKGISMKYPKQ
ncbi:MAG: hypothetical protein R3D88_09040 [Alphaproteobacteria bacterium]|nr:hypothetical protein [Alphaproteobacteria bacterium]